MINLRHSNGGKALLVTCIAILAAGGIAIGLYLSNQKSDAPADITEQANELLAKRVSLDQTIWATEVSAQKYEQVFVELWDNLRNATEKWKVLKQFNLQQFNYGKSAEPKTLEHSITQTSFSQPDQTLSHDQFAAAIDTFRAAGYLIEETEWHHSRFELNASTDAANGKAPGPKSGSRSTVSFVLHIKRNAQQSPTRIEQRIIIRGNLVVDWEPSREIDSTSTDAPTPKTITAKDIVILQRDGGPAFTKVLSTFNDPGQFATSLPALTYDLDGDGLSEIVLPRWNRVYRNQGDGVLKKQMLLAYPQQLEQAGVIGDFNGDTFADLLTVNKKGQLILFAGDQRGMFPHEGVQAANIKFDVPSVMTTGDIDGDGDTDVFAPQYKLSYAKGQMPTPIYDAVDGYPAFLLLNDGKGQFKDITEAAGLSQKRNRRTYSSSLVDLDEDDDLDLLVVSDYAGVDIYRNDGTGKFTDVTADLIKQRHLFGMGHTFGDYNRDGELDFYAIGMSSTTARRLDHMKLGRDDRPDIHKMRAAMGYGNRMYLGSKTKAAKSSTRTFASPSFAADVARTGWSWGATTFDFDNDGDRDIYIANGHRSGKSAKDYCTRFWCHDIYTGDSKPDKAVAVLLSDSLQELNRRTISWNGFEHNVLQMNVDGKGFINVAYLFGASYVYDARAVISDDLDGDGKMDLIVSQSQYDGKGYLMDLHVYRNTLETNNNWIGIRLRELGPGLSPTGAKVTMHSSGGKQIARVVTGDSFMSQHANTVHFGIGKQEKVDRITIRWPNGQVSELNNPAVNQYHPVKAPSAALN